MSTNDEQIKAGLDDESGPVPGDAPAAPISDDPGNPAPPDETPSSADSSISSLETELEQVRAQAAEYEDQCLRARAEADNTRRRASAEVANARKFANENFARELLTVKDSLDLARNVDLEDAGIDVVEKMLEGLDLTSRQFDAAFERCGISEIAPETGEKFDPERHQAMSMQESEGVAPNHVLTVVQKGYALHDRLLRPAMVIVARTPGAEAGASGG